jgi:hypothetical protein
VEVFTSHSSKARDPPDLWTSVAQVRRDVLNKFLTRDFVGGMSGK